MLIPKEDMLCRELKVSKITIREAMKLLVNDEPLMFEEICISESLCPSLHLK
jgi:DNA-binding GntR family transcriptional regulator